MSELHVGRVLLVEQPDGRDILKLVLEHAGFAVDLANDGESGLRLAAARAPAVVVVDVVLPRMDGWELAQRLRKMYGAAIRLIALTNLGEAEDRAQRVPACFDVHLVKPAQPGTVRDTIWHLLKA